MENSKIQNVENFKFEPIKGYPMLHWKGKRPFESTSYYPAQLKEIYGQPDESGWINKIFWGDNLQVMSHLLKEFRGKIKLIYIDPPFDSKADYKQTIKLRRKEIVNDYNSFEEKQYTDIWTNDEYLQFMYERLIIMRELLSDDGSIYLHCDPHKNHYLRMIMDEVFGPENFRNELIWCYQERELTKTHYNSKHDNIYFYVKNKDANYTFNYDQIRESYSETTIAKFKYTDEYGRKYRLRYKDGRSDPSEESEDTYRQYLDESGPLPRDWFNIPILNQAANERTSYPTQKPEAILERIIRASSNPGDIVFDCFMGSGTTMAVALKLGRRFIGSDINLGAIQVSTKRLIQIKNELQQGVNKLKRPNEDFNYFLNFAVYNVNHYDVFRNPIQAKEILLEALEIQKLNNNSVYDGELDGRMVKIMPINRIATKADLGELIQNFDYKLFEKRREERPNQPVEKLLLVCMGHEPDLKSFLQKQVPYKLDIEIVDILRDRQDLQFKREAEADIVIENGKLVIKSFYPMNLLQKLSLTQENVEDWRELVDSIMIDWNYDGAVLEPSVVDVPDKNELVKGVYDIPESAGTIKVKITDLLSESLEVEIDNG